MPGYDKQLTLAFLSHAGEKGHFEPQWKALSEKALAGKIEDLGHAAAIGKAGFASPPDALAKLTKDSRLYLLGHGDWAQQKLGDWGYSNILNMLVDGGLAAVKLVNVVACQLARDKGTLDEQRLAASADSFASKLHSGLGTCGIKTEVRAYLLDNFVVSKATHENDTKFDFPEDTGRKLVYGKDGKAYPARYAKVAFVWQNGVQTRLYTKPEGLPLF